MDRNDLLRIGAPIVAAGTVFIAGKVLRSGYSAMTGNEPPKPDDLDTPVTRVILFAVATAAVTAIINVSVQRGVARAAHRAGPPALAVA